MNSWPDGVVARYQTLTDATVDIHEFDPNTERRHVQCTSCDAEQSYNGDPSLAGLSEATRIRDSLFQCRDWAQAHASTCRALLPPGGTR